MTNPHQAELVERCWTCFHCDETFTDERSARLHFGDDEESKVACQIKAGAEGSILRALRDAERETRRAWGIVHDEAGDVHKAYYAAQCRHTQALQAAEELGFERGLASGRAETAAHIATLETRLAHMTERAGEMAAPASRLLAAFDELRSITTAERIVTGRSDRDLRTASNEAISDLRQALTAYEQSQPEEPR